MECDLRYVVESFVAHGGKWGEVNPEIENGDYDVHGQTTARPHRRRHKAEVPVTFVCPEEDTRDQ